MGKTEQIAEMSVVPAFFVLALNGWKFRPDDQQCPEDCERTQREIRFYDTQRFGAEIRVIEMLRLERIDLLRA